jgi:hypothetical protein
MTVSSTTSRNQYTATSGQTVFPYTFEIFDKGDVVVVQNSTTLVEGAGYTVSGVGNESGGSILLSAGASSGDIITIYRDMPLERNTDYQTSGDFLASEVNNDFDRLWLATQQINELSNRSIKKPDSDLTSINMVLPAASQREDKILAFDSTGAVIVPNISYPILENFLQQASLLNFPTDLGLVSDPVIVYTYDLGAL